MRAVPGGQNVSIPYEWHDAPGATKSFALILVDSAPMARGWVHWAVVNIPASATDVAEGASGTDAMPHGATELDNTFGFAGYGGPQPPVGSGPHAYVATLYALDIVRVDAPRNAPMSQLERLLVDHTLERATCTAYFGR